MLHLAGKASIRRRPVNSALGLTTPASPRPTQRRNRSSPAMASNIKTAYALVDWHNLTGYPNVVYGADPRREIPSAILRLQEQVARALNALEPGEKFRVITRIYHGWHREREEMPVRRDFELFANDRTMARRLTNIVFSAGFQFGNELLCDYGASPLHSTFRGGNQDKGQKMIDTAIVCDCLHLLRFRLADAAIIVADDDDFIPAMLTAQTWKASVMLLRKPGSTVHHVTDVDCTRNLFYWSDQ